MLELGRRQWLEIVAHCHDGLPDEACGLLGGRRSPDGTTRVEVFSPCDNADRSSRTFSIGVDGWRRADEVIGGRGLDVVGVVHSHTHTEAYPSPTDVDRAANPLLAGWLWAIVSLRPPAPVLHAFVIEGGTVVEEPVAVVDR